MIEIETFIIIKPIRLMIKSYFQRYKVKDVEVVFEDIGKQQNGQKWEYTMPEVGRVEKIVIDAGREKKISVIYEREIFFDEESFDRRIKKFGCEWKINEV